MANRKKTKERLTIKPSTTGVRRTWGIKPISRVREDTKKSRLERIRREESGD